MISAPAVLAILGDGQLGRMIAVEAKRLGYTVWAVGADADGPAAQVVDRHIALPLNEAHDIGLALQQAELVTFETEHVPAATLRAVAARTPILPDPEILITLQDRLSQKQRLQRLGMPVATFCEVNTVEDLRQASATLGLPFVFKTRRGGYDGRGQILIREASDLEDGGRALRAWQELSNAPGVAEAFVDFAAEVSIIIARDAEGNFKTFPLAENVHRHHVLRLTRAPAGVAPEVATAAYDLGRRLAGALDYVGVITVELFLLPDRSLLINEVAPRVHNSGHFSWGGSTTSQFEQHVRAICGLPLGDTTTPKAVVMANLLGDLWAFGPPDFEALQADPTIQLYLYGKPEARPGRKMGHLLVQHEDSLSAMARAEDLLTTLERKAGML